MRVGATESSLCEVNMGTPQGSILGPFMFIILINFILLKICSGNFCKTVAYADDTSLLFRISPAAVEDDTLAALANVERAVKIFEKFGLTINAGKTAVVLFRAPQRHPQVCPLQLCGVELQLAPVVRCLGLTIH